jgi:hypothetical protein
MKRNSVDSYFVVALKGACYVFLFCYFGFIINPRWASAGILSSPLYFHWTEAFSPLFRIWIKIFPVVLFVLVVVGFWGMIGLLVTKAKKIALANSEHRFFVQLSGFGFFWLICSIILAMVSQFMYSYQKFDERVWKDSHSFDSIPYQKTLRQRMAYDLIQNVLPGSTSSETRILLGSSSEITGSWPQGAWTCGMLGAPDLSYYIGQEVGGSPLGESLLIWYDQAGNFECATVRQNG